MFKTNAVPVVAVKRGEFNTADVENDIREITPPGGVTVSSIIAKSLNTMTAAASIMVFANGQSILVSEDDLTVPIAGDAGTKVMTIKPVAGQEGRTLAFEQDGAETNGFDAAIKTAVLELINATRPKYSVASLVQNILAKVPALPAGVFLAVSIDQTNGKVRVHTYTDDGLHVDTNDIVDTSDHGLRVTLPITPIVETSGGGDNTLKFEGGAV